MKNDRQTEGNKIIFGKPDKYILTLGLLVFFAAICESVTKQQTKGQKRKLRRSATRLAPSDTDLINSIIEQDFLETVAKQ